MNGLIGVAEGILGLALVSWARTLSLRYNAWTTGLRERHPDFILCQSRSGERGTPKS